MKKSAITSGGASLLEILVCTATAGVGGGGGGSGKKKKKKWDEKEGEMLCK